MQLFGFNIERSQRREEGAAQPSTSQEAKGADIMGKVTYAHGESSSLAVPAFLRAITIHMDTMARLSMEYQRQTAAGNYTLDLGPTRGKYINYLLQVEPNPFTNWTVFMRWAAFQRIMRGNAYIYVERDTAQEIKHLWLCSNGSYNIVDDSYTLTYYVGNIPQTIVSVPSRNVIHLRYSLTRGDGFSGMSLLRYAAQTLNLAATQNQLTLDTMAKGGRHKLLLQEQAQQNMGLGKVQRSEMKTLRNQLEADLPANDVLYVPNVASIENISQTFGELELSVMRKLSVDDISRLTGVPRSLLGADTNSTYKTPDAAMLDFYNNNIAPVVEEIEDEFNRKLLGFDGWGKHRFHMCEDALFRLDRQSQALWNKNRMETGVVSINELRAEMEKEPIENGDDHYVSTNLAVAGSDKLKGSTAPAQPTKGGDQ